MAFQFIRNISHKLANLRGKEDNIEEGIEEAKELLSLDMSDDDLVRQITKDIQDSQPLYSLMKTRMDENEAYYLGDQLDKAVFTYELPTAENLLYRDLETGISIITAKRKEPLVMPAQDTDESRILKQKTQQFLTWKWHEQDMSIKYEDWIRKAEISKIGVFKIRYDQNKDDFEINVLRSQRIMIDKDATDEYNARYIIEFKQDTMADLIGLFPKAKTKLKQAYGEKMGTLVHYVEYWTNEFVVWKVKNIILDKKKNPYWNWDESEKTKSGETKREQSLKKLKKRWIEKTKEEKLENILLNYFDFPRKPYVILSIKNLGKNIYSDTTDFEQAKTAQDIINRRKRQIDKAAQFALGRNVWSGSFITKQEAKKATANPNSDMWIPRGKASDAVEHIAPKPVSPVLFEDLLDTKQEIDNLMSTHGTTRGERGPQETATGRTILREGDFGRIDLTVRRADKKLELLYGWMLQMVKVFYTEQHYIKLLGSEGATTYLDYSQDDVEDGIEIIVKSELTADKATQRQQAIERLGTGTIDPLTMFEKLEEANPKEQTRRLVYYLTDPKLYVAEFAIDENTPGVERNPVYKAKQENKQILQGEPVPPFEEADIDHLREHDKFAKSGELEKEEANILQNFYDHVSAETEIVKQQSRQAGAIR